MVSETDGSPTKRLAVVISDIEKHQTKWSQAINSFKKLKEDDSCAVYRWIKANKELLERDVPAFTDIASEIEALCRDAMLRFEADLSDALSKAGLSLSGQWPSYYVEHIIPVVIDKDEYIVAVGDERLQHFTADAVVESLKTQLQKLKIDRAKLPEFLRELFDAYRNLSSAQGQSVSIRELYRELVIIRQPQKLWRDATPKNFRPFTEAEFRAHITELLKTDQTVISSHQLRLLPPVSKGESLFIYQPAENRFAHVGRVQFLPIAGGESHG
jgi:hypothetical protein